jgi:hypothetical protein
MKALRCALIAGMSLLLLGCPTMQPKYLSQPAAVEATGSYTHSASGMVFPDAVGDFRRTSIRRYDAEGLDVSARYDLVAPPRAVAATVYVYPAPPLVSIGSPQEVVATARANLCQREFETRKQEVLQSHAGAKLVEERAISLVQAGETRSGRMAAFEYEDVFAHQRQAVAARVYLFCYVGGKWVVKYRFSYPKSFDATKEIEEFMRSLSWTVASS